MSDEAELAWRCADAMYAEDTASQAAGIRVDDVAPGRAVASMIVREDMVNGHATCHGGYLFLLADSAFAFACNTDGVSTVAQGADICFLAPARLGDRLEADAHVQARAGRSGVYDVTVRRVGPVPDDVVAVFRGRSREVPGMPFPTLSDAGARSSGAPLAREDHRP